MGIDFSNFKNFAQDIKATFKQNISDLGNAAKTFETNNNTIDTKGELQAYLSGCNDIKAKADDYNNKRIDKNSETVDISELEADMKSELASLMGADFGKSVGVKSKQENGKAVFSDEDISLDNLMSLLDDESIDKSKMQEQIKKPMLSNVSEQTSTIDTLSNGGISPAMFNEVMNVEPGAVKYITNAIKDGSAKNIASYASNFDDTFNGAMQDIRSSFQIRKELRELA